MRYREATLADAEDIAALHAESWRANYRGTLSDEYLDGPIFEERRALWTQRLSEPDANEWTLLAEDESGFVGFACAIGDHDQQLGTYLNNIHVRGAHQGHGIGRSLLISVAQWSLERHPECGLYLGVFTTNERAQRFYRRHGGTDTGGPDGAGEEGRATRTYTWDLDHLRALAASTVPTGS